MTNELADKAHEVRMLTLEVQKIELENRLAQLKSDRFVDEEYIDLQEELDECHETIKQQNQTLLRISAELEAIKQYDPFDLVLITGSIENISKVIKGQTEPIIDEECVGCCKVVDVAANLQKELDEKDKMLEKYGREILCLRDMHDAVRDKVHALEAELSARKEDSAVLKKVVQLARTWQDTSISTTPILSWISDEIVDYLDAPEGSPETSIDEPKEITVACAFLELP